MKAVTNIIYILLSFILFSCVRQPDNCSEAGSLPCIYPDYSGITIPVNIAPMNFRIEEVAEKYYVEFMFDENVVVAKGSRSPNVKLSAREWKKVMKNGADKTLSVRIYTYNDNKWTKYSDIKNTISPDPIDRYLTYRLIAPGYELWNDMGIYQRDLTSFSQEAILTNEATQTGCMNCHTYANHSAQTAMLHLRGEIGGTLIKRNGTVEKVSFKSGDMISEGIYPAWHPSARYIAYSTNEINQYFHFSGKKPIEVSDRCSDLMVYDIDKNEILTSDLIYGDQYMETFPEWSSDGKTLYFTRADSISVNHKLDSIFYDLCSIDFDSESCAFSNFKVLFSGKDIHQSVSFPKVIPGSDNIVFTLSDYGNFSIWHPESDLYLINTVSGEYRRIDEVNSDDTDSFHSFSSTGCWMVISSRRDDGLYTRPYIAHFDTKTSTFSKPFPLPQETPDFYTTQFKSYNLPQFTVDKFLDRRGLLDAAMKNNNKKANFSGK